MVIVAWWLPLCKQFLIISLKTRNLLLIYIFFPQYKGIEVLISWYSCIRSWPLVNTQSLLIRILRTNHHYRCWLTLGDVKVFDIKVSFSNTGSVDKYQFILHKYILFSLSSKKFIIWTSYISNLVQSFVSPLMQLFFFQDMG